MRFQAQTRFSGPKPAAQSREDEPAPRRRLLEARTPHTGLEEDTTTQHGRDSTSHWCPTNLTTLSITNPTCTKPASPLVFFADELRFARVLSVGARTDVTSEETCPRQDGARVVVARQDLGHAAVGDPQGHIPSWASSTIRNRTGLAELVHLPVALLCAQDETRFRDCGPGPEDQNQARPRDQT